MTHPLLPVEIVLAPDWWHRHAGICFDPDFFFHPARRVEDERKMERVLSERWGRCGLSADADTDVPLVGATHLAAGYLLSEMLGCRVEYLESAPPQVIPAGLDRPQTDPDAAFRSEAFRRFQTLRLHWLVLLPSKSKTRLTLWNNGTFFSYLNEITSSPPSLVISRSCLTRSLISRNSTPVPSRWG